MEFFNRGEAYNGSVYLGHAWCNISMFDYFHKNDLLNHLSLFFMLKHEVKIIYAHDLVRYHSKYKRNVDISIVRYLTDIKAKGITTNLALMTSYIDKLVEIGVIYKSKKGDWHFAGVKTINRLFPYIDKDEKVYNSKLIKISVFDNYEITRKLIFCSKIISSAIKQKKEVERISGIQSILDKINRNIRVSKEDYKLYIRHKKLKSRKTNVSKSPKRNIPYLTLSRIKIANLYLFSDVVNLCTADKVKKFLQDMGILEFRRKLKLVQENVTYKYFLDVQANYGRKLVFKYTINGLGNIYSQLSSEYKIGDDSFKKYNVENPIDNVVNFDTNFKSLAIIKNIKEQQHA